MGALVKHLHALAREIELTDEEWFVGIDFLTRPGKFSSGSRQEFVLLSDVPRLSMLTVGLATRSPPEPPLRVWLCTVQPDQIDGPAVRRRDGLGGLPMSTNMQLDSVDGVSARTRTLC
jgi:hypothetical protein